MAFSQDRAPTRVRSYGVEQNLSKREMLPALSGEQRAATGSVQDNVYSVLERAGKLIPSRRREPLKLIFGLGAGELSHVLLHAVTELREHLRLEIALAYIDFNSSPFSEIEAQFVKRLAERYDVPLAILHPSEEEFEIYGSFNVSALRTHLLERLRIEHHAHFTVTAQGPHERAEHFLRLLVSGMTATELITIGPIDRRRRILRPLLAVPHSLVRLYSNKHQLKFIPEGGSDDLKLSMIRDRLLPFLERHFEAGIVNSLNAMADRIAGDEERLWLDAAEHFDQAEMNTLVPMLENLSPALQWRVLALLAEEQIGEAAKRLSHFSLMRLAEKITVEAGTGWNLSLGDNVNCMLTEPGELQFSTEAGNGSDSNSTFTGREAFGGRDALAPLHLKVPGVVLRSYDDGSAVSVEARIVENTDNGISADLNAAGGNPYSMARAYFSIEKVLNGTLIIRERRPGDRIQISEVNNVRVKKLFEEHGVPAAVSERIPLAELDDKILWVPGIATAASAAREHGDGAAVELSYRRRD